MLTLAAAAPNREIYDFAGDVTLYDETYEGGCIQDPLGLENTLWANTVLASGTACGLVVHTGAEVCAAAASRRCLCSRAPAAKRQRGPLGCSALQLYPRAHT